MTYEFRSSLAEKLIEFLRVVKTLGYQYTNGERHMRGVDEAAIKFQLSVPYITPEFSNEYCKRKPSESLDSRYYRIVCFRKFAKFVFDLGNPSFIPELPPPPKSSGFVPYVYTDEQLNSLIKAADELRVTYGRQGNSNIFIIPVLFRLLIATGIRIGEALNLKTSEINLEENYLIIRKSKNQKERIIPFSASLSTVLAQHKNWMETLCLKRHRSPYFFICPSGNKATRNGITNHWRSMLSKANIPFVGRSLSPRIHDLRHTFAVNALQKLKDQGINFYSALPIVSVYLGHQNFHATEHYLQLTENNFPAIFEDVEILTNDLYPKL